MDLDRKRTAAVRVLEALGYHSGRRMAAASRLAHDICGAGFPDLLAYLMTCQTVASLRKRLFTYPL